MAGGATNATETGTETATALETDHRIGGMGGVGQEVQDEADWTETGTEIVDQVVRQLYRI